METWRRLAERLVQVDLAIENLDGWATTPEDVEELERLEALRNELQRALTSHHVSHRLRRRLEGLSPSHAGESMEVEPRD